VGWTPASRPESGPPGGARTPFSLKEKGVWLFKKTPGPPGEAGES